MREAPNVPLQRRQVAFESLPIPLNRPLQGVVSLCWRFPQTPYHLILHTLSLWMRANECSPCNCQIFLANPSPIALSCGCI